MGIVFAGIAPHGFSLIPELGDDDDGALKTRSALYELGRQFDAAEPEVIVIASPHGVRVDGAIALGGAGRAAGTLGWGGRHVEMNIPIDLELTDAIASNALARQIPIAIVGFGGNRRDQSVLPLDWGTLVPLWFLGHDRNIPGSGRVISGTPDGEDGLPVVLVSPSRSLSRSTHIEVGHAIADTANASGRRVAVIASCDWAHTHSATGPYGYHPLAAETDALIVDLVARNALGELAKITDETAQAVAMDGLWQALVLSGVVQSAPMPVTVLGYEVADYFGMLVACWSAV